MRLLIVEDDLVLADALVRALGNAGYAVDHLSCGADADGALIGAVHDLVILDLGLPKMDGFEVVRRLRARRSTIPVLILTAREAVQDRVRGLDLGAEDYLLKPFEMAELEARVLFRRGVATGGAIINLGTLRFDSAGRRVFIGDRSIDLSARELGVLEALLIRSGKVVSKEQLVEHLCNWDEVVGTNAIEVYVHRLRKKLEPEVEIRTVRGLGYLLDNPHAA
jgi:two-component system OmpR family response regulator